MSFGDLEKKFASLDASDINSINDAIDIVSEMKLKMQTPGEKTRQLSYQKKIFQMGLAYANMIATNFSERYADMDIKLTDEQKAIIVKAKNLFDPEMELSEEEKNIMEKISVIVGA